MLSFHDFRETKAGFAVKKQSSRESFASTFRLPFSGEGLLPRASPHTLKMLAFSGARLTRKLHKLDTGVYACASSAQLGTRAGRRDEKKTMRQLRTPSARSRAVVQDMRSKRCRVYVVATLGS